MRTNVVNVKIVAVEKAHPEAEVSMYQPVPSVKGGS
jgi:hypothetical protein